ncbi:MAG: hypothetical protein LBV12_05910 [Puniceicoccales bacterium]|jgi:hypothetical protein|nr:hypothetical protein [Puniceicoccales bacterium]
MKLPTLARTLLAALALAPAVTLAADETVAGSLTVEQDLLVYQKIEVGEASGITNASPAYSLQANSLLGSTIIDQIGYGTNTSWSWMVFDGTASKQLLKLENNGKLSLYSPSSPTSPMIVLDPSITTPVVTVAGKKVVTEENIGIILKNTLIGNDSEFNCVAIGNSASANNEGSMAIGNYSEVFGRDGIALGSYSMTNDNGIALGRSTMSGSSGIALGSYTRCNDRAIAIGNDTSATTPTSIALGISAVADNNSVVVGSYSEARGESAITIGGRSSAMQNFTTAIGNWAIAEADSSMALGVGTHVTQSFQVALGSYNNPLNNAFLMIGNGTAGYDRSNLFVIMKDGRGVFRSTSYVEPATTIAAQEKEALTVEGAATIKGDAKVTGTLRVRPAGDLSMGSFTVGTQP